MNNSTSGIKFTFSTTTTTPLGNSPSGLNSSDFFGPASYNSVSDFGLDRDEDLDFIEEETSELNEGDENGNNVLLFAVCQGREDIVKSLIEQGVYIDHQNNQGETALYWSTSSGYSKMTELLLQSGANPNISNVDGVSPLHMAAANGNLEHIRTLIRCGAHVNSQDEELDTPLHYAVRECRLDVVRAFVIELNARVDAKNEDLETPLDLALCLESSSIDEDYGSIVKILSTPLELKQQYFVEMEKKNKKKMETNQHKGSFEVSQVQATLIY